MRSIGNYAFYDCSSLTAINIPEGVTSIGYDAFSNCSSLTAINIPESVTSIGISAFEPCSRLTYINIPKGVTEIGYTAFYNCTGLTAINIPENVTKIGLHAFEGCSKLTYITIPKGVTEIGDNAFKGCSKLKTVINYSNLNIKKGSADNGYVAYYADRVINDVDKIINGYVFETKDNASYLAGYVGNDTELTLPEDYEGKSYQIGVYAFLRCNDLTSINIPESVTNIGDYAFYECTSLTASNIPEGVTSIGYAAFYNCTGLTAINIPKGVTSIGNYAFSGCSSLTAINVEEGNEVYDSRNGCSAIIETNSNTLIQGCSTTIIPEGVTSIGGRAFEGCSSLTAINIPEGVTSIGERAFYRCSGLTTITIPESMTSIGERPFVGCNSLTTIHISNLEAWCKISFEDNTSNPFNIAKKLYLNGKLVTELVIPEGVTSIGEYAFYNLSSLTAITIPESVTSIGNEAFKHCSSITAITCKAISPPSASSSTFSGANVSIPVYVPSGSVEAYKAANGWRNNFINFIGTDFTGIDNTEVKNENSTIIYDLHGHRVENATKPGIYIVNGRKVVIK